jgi:hypothetical protein
LLRQDSVTRAEGTGKDAPVAGYRGDLPPPAGEATTTGSLATGAGGGAALGNEPALPESIQGDDGVPSPRWTTRGDGWCWVAVAIASRVGTDGAWKNTHV